MSVEFLLYCCLFVKFGLDFFCSLGNKSKKVCKLNEIICK